MKCYMCGAEILAGQTCQDCYIPPTWCPPKPPTPLTLAAIERRQRRYEHLCALFGVQDRDESEEGYTAEEWREYRERTNDEAERRMRP